MDNPGEILRLCRLCLVKDQVNIPIFEEQGDIRQTFLKIRSCLPVKVSRDDKLPKKICGGCSNKLDLFYEFWSSTANSEKTLQSWLGQEEEDDKMQEITKPVEALVKEESEALEDGHAHDQSFDEATKDEAEAPPAKRARRTAAVKAQINISHDSDEDEDVDGAEPITKIEDESDDSDGEEKDPSYTEVPGTSADDQAGPSGLGKDGVEAPYVYDMLTLKFETREYICDYCSQYFEKYRQLAYHLRTKHKSQDDFACPTCAKTFKTRSRLSRHCEQCLGPSTKGTFQCHTCDKVLCSKQALVTHTKRHSRVYDIKCQFCGKGFFSNSSLRLHVNSRHTGKSRFVCDICSRSCYDKTALKNHMEKHEPGYKLRSKVKCPQCEQEFLDKKYLKIHLSKKHGTDSKFICDLCGKELYSKSGLKDHMNIHQGLKPHKCELCGEGFANSTTLRLHCRRHTGERPYKCTMCDKAFTQSHTLKVHVRKHTGEKPYSCNICDRGFVSSSILRSHMKGTHRTD
ncbi:zinc finger protein OZF-like isoform X42 [Euwallacea similis]|uniref:zinc finger protein OZF-like isoform X42 n=1 Tax=Euwallacea similis TaxID=1736056 RepID=UPI00344DAF01